VETSFANPTQVDVFRIYQIGAAGEDIGLALVHYNPQSGNQTWQGELSLSTDVAGWGQWDVADLDFTWYRFTNGVYDQTTATGTVAEFTSSHGGDGAGARFSFNFGCDGRPFGIDGFEVGSSTSGWNAFNFEGYPSKVELSAQESTLDRCALSVRSFPREVTFAGTLTEPGGWRGWQYAGVGKSSKWVAVPKASGSTSNGFSYRARVAENSWFDASYGPTSTHEYSDSRDIYVPAFPSIELKAADRTVTRGRQLVVTGAFKPARPLPFEVLYTVAEGQRWGALRKIKSLRADQQGRFRFTVPTGRLGWGAISVFTKTAQDLTTTISRQSVLYKVVKPKAPKPPPAPPTFVSTDDDEAATGSGGDAPEGEIHGRLHRALLEKPRGYGGCDWYLPGRPPGRVALGRTVDPAGLPLVTVPATPHDLPAEAGEGPTDRGHPPVGSSTPVAPAKGPHPAGGSPTSQLPHVHVDSQ
jgi:hypothetical protein